MRILDSGTNHYDDMTCSENRSRSLSGLLIDVDSGLNNKLYSMQQQLIKLSVVFGLLNPKLIGTMLPG